MPHVMRHMSSSRMYTQRSVAEKRRTRFPCSLAAIPSKGKLQMFRKDEGMLNSEPVTPSSQSGDVMNTLCEL